MLNTRPLPLSRAFLVGSLCLPLAGPASTQPADAPAVAGETVLLRMNPVPGEELRQRMTMTMEMNQAMPGQAEPMKMLTDMVMDFTQVALDEEPEEGDLVMQTTFDRARMDMTPPMGDPIHLDTDEPDDAAAGPAAAALAPLRGMIGKPIRTTMTRRGEVLSVDAGGASGPGMSPEVMEQMMANQPVLPEGALAVGESWVQEAEAPVPGGPPMSMEVTWTLTAIEPGLARFDLDGDNDLRAEMPQGGTIDMNIRSTGTASLDRATGMLHAMNLDQVMTGGVDVMDQSMPFDMEMNMAVEAVD